MHLGRTRMLFSLAIVLMAATPAMACKNYTAIAIFDAIVAARDAAIEAQSERIQDAVDACRASWGAWWRRQSGEVDNCDPTLSGRLQ
ncbi:MAG: hypothetical protein M3Z85_13205, partial [Acidobacteriota bacterium]|nr:hypothetical protein [Acidobacteriota bacterium]